MKEQESLFTKESLNKFEKLFDEGNETALTAFLSTQMCNTKTCSHFSHRGHYDTFMSKSIVSVISEYLYEKYGESTFTLIDENMELAKKSIEALKVRARSFPKLVNKTLNTRFMYIPIGTGSTYFVAGNLVKNKVDISIDVFIIGDRHEKYMGKFKEKISSTLDKSMDLYTSKGIYKKILEMNFAGRVKVSDYIDDLLKLSEYTEKDSDK